MDITHETSIIFTLTCAFIVLILLMGFIITFSLITLEHRESAIIFTVFVASCFNSLQFVAFFLQRMNLEYNSRNEKVLNFDFYTFPMFCFMISFSSTFSSFKELRIRETKILAYCIVIFIMIILVKEMLIYPDDYCIEIEHGQEGTFCVLPLTTVQHARVSTLLEYVLIYSPFAIRLVRKNYGTMFQTDALNRPQEKFNINDNQKEKCYTCKSNSLIVSYIAKCFLYIVWIVRPIFIVLDIFLEVNMQSFVPGIFMFSLHFFLLCLYLTNRNLLSYCSERTETDTEKVEMI